MVRVWNKIEQKKERREEGDRGRKKEGEGNGGEKKQVWINYWLLEQIQNKPKKRKPQFIMKNAKSSRCNI